MLSSLFYPRGKEKASRKTLEGILMCTSSCGVSECQTLFAGEKYHPNLQCKLGRQSAAASRRMSTVLPSLQDHTASKMPFVEPGQTHYFLLQYLNSAYLLPNWEQHLHGYILLECFGFHSLWTTSQWREAQGFIALCSLSAAISILLSREKLHFWVLDAESLT